MVFFINFHKQLILSLAGERNGVAHGFSPMRAERLGAMAKPPPSVRFALYFLSDIL